MSSEAITRNDLEAILNEIFNPLPLIDLYYPIGSYYETSDTTFNPNIEWGGTWELEIEGQVHVSAGTNYTINGASTNISDGGTTVHAHGGVTGDHTLTAAQSGVPQHTHTYADANTTYTAKTASRKPGTSTAVTYCTGLTAGGGTSTKTSDNNTAKNATQAHNHGISNGSNMQPYIIVNRWHRTA